MFQLLDGAMGTELKNRYPFEKDDYIQLWSSAPLLNKKGQQIIKDIHLDYINSGSDIITTNTYACTKYFLDKKNLGNKQIELITLACKLAKESVKEINKDIKIAGSIPPLNSTYSKIANPRYVEYCC